MNDDEYELPAERPFLELRETAAVYDSSPPPDLRVIRGGKGRGRKSVVDGGGGKMKTSVYLEVGDISRLGWLAEVEGRAQAEIIRDAIRAYRPRSARRTFALFDVPLDAPTDDITQAGIELLMDGFGEPGIG